MLGKIKEGKKLSTEEVLVLYLGTIVNELKDVRSGVARQRNCLREKIFKSPFSLYLERPVAQRSSNGEAVHGGSLFYYAQCLIFLGILT